MTKEAAVRQATLDAVLDRRDKEVWEHVGGTTRRGTKVLPQGRCIVRDPAIEPPPPYVWAKVQTLTPNGTARAQRPRADWTPEELAVEVVTTAAANVGHFHLTSTALMLALAEAIRADREAQATRARP